jgi:hypothetical protein
MCVQRGALTGTETTAIGGPELAFDWLSIGFAEAPIIDFAYTIGFDLSILFFWADIAFADPFAGRAPDRPYADRTLLA